MSPSRNAKNEERASRSQKQLGGGKLSKGREGRRRKPGGEVGVGWVPCALFQRNNAPSALLLLALPPCLPAASRRPASDRTALLGKPISPLAYYIRKRARRRPIFAQFLLARQIHCSVFHFVVSLSCGPGKGEEFVFPSPWALGAGPPKNFSSCRPSLSPW